MTFIQEEGAETVTASHKQRNEYISLHSAPLWPRRPSTGLRDNSNRIHSPRSALTLPAYFLPRLWLVFGGFPFWNCAGTGPCSGSLQEVDTSSSSLFLLWSFPTLRLSSASGSSMPACCRLLRDRRLLCCCLRFSSSCCRCFIFISFSKLLVVVGFTTNQSYRGKTETSSSQNTVASIQKGYDRSFLKRHG